MRTIQKYNFDLAALKKAIGMRIKTLRVQKGMVQNDLAELLKVKRANISGIESGRISPNIAHLLIISETFNTSVDYILYGKGAEKISVPDFKELTGKILEMLNDMSKNEALLHSVLSSYYEKKLESPPGTGQKMSIK